MCTSIQSARRSHLYVGDTISCRVISLHSRGITVMTSKLVKGYIPIGKIGDENSLQVRSNWIKLINAKPPLIRPGDHIDATLVGINYDILHLILSWKVDRSRTDEHHNHDENRTVTHPVTFRKGIPLSFKASLHKWYRGDIHSGEEAEEALASGNRGDALLRYCSENIFCIDFKVSEDHVLHVQIAEESRNGQIRYAVTNSHAIYEDIDHFYVEYVVPYLKRFQELEACPRSFFGSLTVAKSLVKAEASSTRKTSWRVFCSKRNPLYIAIIICSPKICGEHVLDWPIRMEKNGWAFKVEDPQRLFSSLDELIKSCHSRLHCLKK